MTKRIDLTGQRFGTLVVKEYVGIDKYGRARWCCICDCGKEIIALANNLKQPAMRKSCGCLKGAKVKHGQCLGNKITREYETYRHMLLRCFNPKYDKYKYYGGRGITVCKEWRNDFQNFLRDMGKRPEGKTLDRINPYGNYEPSNCKWSTPYEQMHNRRPQRKKDSNPIF